MKSGLKIYKITLLRRAENELDLISEYYENISSGLGTKFYIQATEYIDSLAYIPYFENKYSKIRILPLKKFPYSIHFTINEELAIVEVHAIVCDFQNPDSTRIKL